jgi:transposase
MEQVLDGKLTIKLAAELLGLSERQVKRLKKGMKEKGVAALMHGNRGRTPKHTISEDIRDMVAALAQDLYKDASAQHISELLAEYQDVHISARSVRRILKERGIPNPHSRKQSRRRRKSRDRAPKPGMLVQMDASPFEWIEDRGPKCDLHGAIDDATGKILGLHFRPQEDLRGYLELLKYMITHYGIPRALYTDGHTIFFSPKKDKLTIEEELEGKQVALTQFGRVIDELGILASLPPRAKVHVLIHLDDSIEAMYQEKLYSLCEFEPVPAPKPVPAPAGKKPTGHKPNPNNPWLKFKIPPKHDDPVEQYFQKRNKRLSLILQQYQN